MHRTFSPLSPQATDWQAVRPTHVMASNRESTRCRLRDQLHRPFLDLFLIVVAISLIGLWVVSYFGCPSYQVSGPNAQWHLSAAAGRGQFRIGGAHDFKELTERIAVGFNYSSFSGDAKGGWPWFRWRYHTGPIAQSGQWSQWELIFPLVIVIAVIIVYPIFDFWRAVRKVCRAPRFCPNCGYSLKGNIGKSCPECGSAQSITV